MLTEVDPRVLGEMARQLSVADVSWARHYGEYQSGGWWTSSLLGRSADARDAIVADSSDPTATQLLDQLPAFEAFLEALGLRYMNARLARMDAGAALWEHRDYQDLAPVARHRLHVPLQTNRRAVLVTAGGHSHHLPSGGVYLIQPRSAHAACNRGTQARVHLVADVYEDAALVQVLDRATPSTYVQLRDVPIGIVQALLRELDGAGTESDVPSESERRILTLYFDYAPGEGQLYRWLEDAYTRQGNRARAAFWAQRRRRVLTDGVYA